MLCGIYFKFCKINIFQVSQNFLISRKIGYFSWFAKFFLRRYKRGFVHSIWYSNYHPKEKMQKVALFFVLFITLVFGQAEFCKGLTDPCEEQACALACADCNSGCVQLESFPVIYSCENPQQSFSRNDVCNVVIQPTSVEPDTNSGIFWTTFDTFSSGSLQTACFSMLIALVFINFL